MIKINVKCLGLDCPADIKDFFNNGGKVRRAGFIPYKIDRGHVILLLGSWPDKRVYADFGGKCDRESTLQCAIRETKEETLDVIDITEDDLKNITHIVTSDSTVIIFIRMERLSNRLSQEYRSKLKTYRGLIENGNINYVPYESFVNRDLGPFALSTSLRGIRGFLPRTESGFLNLISYDIS